jgi:hypothetical protein
MHEGVSGQERERSNKGVVQTEECSALVWPRRSTRWSLVTRACKLLVCEQPVLKKIEAVDLLSHSITKDCRALYDHWTVGEVVLSIVS